MRDGDRGKGKRKGREIKERERDGGVKNRDNGGCCNLRDYIGYQ